MSSSISREALALEDGSTRRGGVGSRGTGGDAGRAGRSGGAAAPGPAGLAGALPSAFLCPSAGPLDLRC